MSVIFQRDFDQETDQEARRSGGLLSEEALREIREAAFEAGRAQGEVEAERRMRAAAETRRVETLGRISDQVSRLITDREAHEQALEAQLLDYAISIGEKVLPDLIETRSHQHVISQIRKAVRMGLGSGRVRIRLSAEDRALLGADLADLERPPERTTRVEIVTCDRLRAGDLEVDWDQGGLAYSFSTVCEEVLSLLRKTKPVPASIGAENQTT